MWDDEETTSSTRAFIKNNDSKRANYGSTNITVSAGDENDCGGGGVQRQCVRFVENGGCGNDGRGVRRSLTDRLDDRVPATAANVAAVLLSVLIAWCLLLVNVTPALMAVPGGSVASVFLLYAISLAAGWAVDAIAGLPSLLGMMVAGIALENCGLYTVTEDWCVHLVAIMREGALSVILIKGGLEMNPFQLRRLSGAVTRLSLLPCIGEAVAAGAAAHYVLPDFSWVWGLALGFTLSAVSPAVLVPSLLKLQHMGYGEENGINTLVIAASSLDDIISISAFGVLLGIGFSTGDLTSKIVQGPEDICIGTALGLVWGFLLIFVPPSPWANVLGKNVNENEENEEPKRTERSVTGNRSFLLGAGGFLAVTAGQRYGYPGAGPLACIISSFVAGNGWKWRAANHHNLDVEGLPIDDNSVEKVFEIIWFGLQPVLFASIGTEIKFKLLAGGDIILPGFLVLLFGLLVRLIVTSCSVIGTGYNRKEVTFINIAWLPKATVQAALAPVALDMARTLGSTEDIASATRLLTIAVISILVTAPVGALGIQWFGPRLLSPKK